MRALRAIAGELAGLFVEDRTFAIAIAIVLALFGAARALHVADPRVAGYALVAFLAVALVASVAAAAKRSGCAGD